MLYFFPCDPFMPHFILYIEVTDNFRIFQAHWNRFYNCPKNLKNTADDNVSFRVADRPAALLPNTRIRNWDEPLPSDPEFQDYVQRFFGIEKHDFDLEAIEELDEDPGQEIG